jgi:hypothetical protein
MHGKTNASTSRAGRCGRLALVGILEDSFIFL